MINLNVKSNYSLLSSMLRIDDIINYSKKNNLDICSLCDNTMYGVMEFYNKCISNNLKPVIGLNINVIDFFVYLYCIDYDGYKNLIKLCTISSERDIFVSDLEQYNSNLICIINYKDRNKFSVLSNIYDDLYIGYSSKNEEIELLKSTQKIVYFKECLYLNYSDSEYLNYLYLIRDGKKISDEYNYDILSKELNFSYNNISNIGITNILKICSKCNLEFPSKELLLPLYKTPEGVSDVSYLYNLSMAGLKKRLNNKVSDIYLNRLIYELDVINKMGFCNYFLIVYDFIKYAKTHDILVGPGRGSAAGSLVSYSLGITEIDPIKYNLIFERFLNPERKQMPDIDTDFPDEKREEVIKYVTEKYGNKNVSGIVTFGTLSSKQVLRDLGRVLNIPSYKLDSLNKLILANSKDTLSTIFKNNPRFKLMIESDTTLKNLFRIALKIEGFPRHISSHAAGIIMSKVKLDTIIPLTRNDSMYLSCYTMEYLEDMGLLKMDFLGLKNLSIIEHILKDIEHVYGDKINFNNIPLNDEKVFDIFKNGDTVGIFQFESNGMKNFLKRLQPENLDDIFAAIALFRPGPAENIDKYIRRRHHLEEVTYFDESLKEVLKNTYGIFIYQEQIMQAASVFAGYSLGEADILRRAMSKKKFDLLKAEKEKFVKGSIERGKDKDTANKIFDLILNFAGYGFNKSHSVAYSIIAYKMAYFKVYYKDIFYCNLLNNVIGSDIKTHEYILEIRDKKLDVLPPDINISDNYYKVIDNKIYYPFTNIKSIGLAAGNKIILARGDTSFTDIYDSFSRLIINNVSKSTIEALIFSLSFRSFSYNRRTLMENLDELINYGMLTKDLDFSLVMKPEIEIKDEYDTSFLLEKEKEIFGFYLSSHPTDSYKSKKSNIIDLKDISNYFDKVIKTIIFVEDVRIIKTKKGEDMAFVTGSDIDRSVCYTLFPRTYNIYNNINRGDILEVVGRVEKRYNDLQIIASKLEKLN